MPVMPSRKKIITEPAIEEETVDPVLEAEETPEAPPASQEDMVTFKRSHFYSVLTVLARYH